MTPATLEATLDITVLVDLPFMCSPVLYSQSPPGGSFAFTTRNAAMPGVFDNRLGWGASAYRLGNNNFGQCFDEDLIQKVVDKVLILSYKEKQTRDCHGIMRRLGGVWQGSAVHWDIELTAIAECGILNSNKEFFMICGDEDNNVWFVVYGGPHSIGRYISNIHAHVANSLMKRYFIHEQNSKYSYLVEGTHEIGAFTRDASWLIEYGKVHRNIIAERFYEELMSFSDPSHNGSLPKESSEFSAIVQSPYFSMQVDRDGRFVNRVNSINITTDSAVVVSPEENYCHIVRPTSASDYFGSIPVTKNVTTIDWTRLQTRRINKFDSPRDRKLELTRNLEILFSAHGN